MGAAALYDARRLSSACNTAHAFQTVAAVDTADGRGRVPTSLLVPLPEQVLWLPACCCRPTLLDGAFQGLVALADPAPAGGRRRAALAVRPGPPAACRQGLGPSTARLHVTRVGPRSVNADIVAAGPAPAAVVAEALDCWFVRVALGANDAARDGRLFHSVDVASPDPLLAGIAGPMLRLALGAESEADGTGPHESVLLADAFAASAADEAVRAIIPDPLQPFTASGLVADGALAAAARPAFHRLLQWLEADGLAEPTGDGWRLIEAEAPAADDILRTLVFDTPGAVAEAALLAAAAEALPGQLRHGAEPQGMPPASLAEQFLHSSPAGVAARDALIAAVRQVARAWPPGQPLRLLQVGAWRGSFARSMLRQLALDGLEALHIDAVTSPADEPALARALTGFANAKAVSWPNGRVPADAPRYDVIVGFCPVSLGGLQADDLAALLRLAPGGLALLLEPAPTRTWSLVWPSAIDRLRDGAGWRAALAAAGGADAECRLVGDSWPANLIAATLPALGSREAPVLTCCWWPKRRTRWPPPLARPSSGALQRSRIVSRRPLQRCRATRISPRATSCWCRPRNAARPRRGWSSWRAARRPCRPAAG